MKPEGAPQNQVPKQPTDIAEAEQLLKSLAEKTKSKGESAPAMPKVGEMVILKKISMQQGQESALRAGEALQGPLVRDIEVGKSVTLGFGRGTSPVRAIRTEGGRIYIDTQTSTYEVSKE